MRDALKCIACVGQHCRQEPKAGLLVEATDAETSDTVRSRNERGVRLC